MVDLQTFTAALKKTPIISILRGITPATAADTAKALAEGGIRFIEVTLNSPDALTSIQILSEVYAQDKEFYIGAGTVTKPQEVDAVARAGGKYIISPNTNPDVIRRTKGLGLISIPGFYTPTEAFAAIDAGADFLKCFPVRNLGEGYIKDIKAVVSKPIIAVGGVDLDNMQKFLRVCAGVGIGSNLYSPEKTPADLKHVASEYCRKIC